MIRSVKNLPSANFDERPEDAPIKYLIYHATHQNLDESLRLLTQPNIDPPVSSHYLICEEGQIYSLVPEEKRAWHAGRLSAWETDVRINATSIGIELVNPGMGPNYRGFPKPQMQALQELTKDILTRHTITPFHILAHSDIAPDRKNDPGDRFDWKGLADLGIGVYPPVTQGIETSILDVQRKLKAYGYKIDLTGERDAQTQCVFQAFQMHFGYGDLGQMAAKLDWLLQAKAGSFHLFIGNMEENRIEDRHYEQG
jgi:N-acetylmuramoyl-L-alanine amidase